MCMFQMTEGEIARLSGLGVWGPAGSWLARGEAFLQVLRTDSSEVICGVGVEGLSVWFHGKDARDKNAYLK